MEVPIGVQDNQDIQNTKEQYKQGPPQSQDIHATTQTRQMTDTEIEEEKDRLMKIYKKDLPFLRIQDEYQKLSIATAEQAVILGHRPVNTVPGLLGLELMAREIKGQGFLADWKNAMDHAIAEDAKRVQDQQTTPEMASNTVQP